MSDTIKPDTFCTRWGSLAERQKILDDTSTPRDKRDKRPFSMRILVKGVKIRGLRFRAGEVLERLTYSEYGLLRSAKWGTGRDRKPFAEKVSGPTTGRGAMTVGRK
jgi:hypothetical protein